jgi:nucleosome assembly protein 1-like 1
MVDNPPPTDEEIDVAPAAASSVEGETITADDTDDAVVVTGTTKASEEGLVAADDDNNAVVTELTEKVQSSLAIAASAAGPSQDPPAPAASFDGNAPPEVRQDVAPPPAAAAAAAPAFAFDFNAPPPVVRRNAAPRYEVDDDDDDDEDDEEFDPAAMNNEFLALLPPCVLPRIDKLKVLNNKRDEIMEEYRVERAQLEMKYAEKMKPLYDERKGVVNGEYDTAIINELEPKEGEGKFLTVNPETAPHLQGDQVKGIPQFWACAMGHVDVIAELVTESDVDCLEHLTDVTCTDFPDGLGFELHFHFAPNDFFTNTILSKRYEVPNLLTEDEPILKNITGTEIQWKTGQSLTYREVTKKQRKKGGKAAGQVRSIIKRERTESFFHFFTPVKMPAMSDVVDEDEADAIEDAFDHDYDVAQAFRSHLIKKAVLWFTGEAMIDDYDEEGMMGGDEDGEEEEGLINGEARPVDAEGRPVQLDLGGSNPPTDGENPECKQS